MAKRDIFGELMEGAAAMKSHREGKLTLRSYKVAAAPLPKVDSKLIRDTRTSLPVVNEIIFQRPPDRVKMAGTRSWTKLPEAPRDVFEPSTGSSEWCPGIFSLVPDPDSPNHFRRELVGVGPGF